MTEYAAQAVQIRLPWGTGLLLIEPQDDARRSHEGDGEAESGYRWYRKSIRSILLISLHIAPVQRWKPPLRLD